MAHVEPDRRVQRHQQAVQGLIAQRGLVDGQTLVITSVGPARGSEAITLRMKAGKAAVPDGPFTETKEVLAGFDLTSFASCDDAVAFARTCCVHEGHVTEIRPVQGRWRPYHDPGIGNRHPARRASKGVRGR